jgi:hypothetical protein
MMNVCFQCGMYRAHKIIDPAGPWAVCPECGYKHTFLQSPLLIVSGASCAGKSTVCRRLVGQITKAVLLDSDILWRPEFNRPDTSYRDFFETWLRVCKNISQSGRPFVFFGAGMGVPSNLEDCIERRYFSAVHYLPLVCSKQALVDRLQERPAWRGTREQAFIDEQIRFNNWFKAYNRQPAITLIDTTDLDPGTTVPQVRLWIEQCARSFTEPHSPVRKGEG